MKIQSIKNSAHPDVKIVLFDRFSDGRGYFTEQFRRSDFDTKCDFLKNVSFVQANESFSKKGVVRGLHFQWNPYMGKLVRTIYGCMVDLFLDIRKGSPLFGKIYAYEMPNSTTNNYDQWIWVPPGFAHGNFFMQETVIEYFCSGEYSQGCEAGISPFAPDLDWSECDPALRSRFIEIASGTPIVTDKDKNGFTLAQWDKAPLSDNFIYGKC